MTENLVAQIKKVRLGPKDTLVIEAPGVMTDETVKRITAYGKKCGIKMIVLADGLKVKKVVKGHK